MQQVATLKGLRCPRCGSEHLTVTGIKGALGAATVVGLAFGAVGNLVAGKNAAANTATEPLQYKCNACKNKFESLPLAAPPEEILSMPCNVTFKRERGFVGSAVPQILYLNGVKLGAVKNGATVSFTTNSRYNVLFVTDQHGVAFKSEYRFEAQPGQNVSVSFKNRFLNAPVTPASTSPMTDIPRTQISAPVSSGTAEGALPVRFCTNCGNALSEQSMFCPACGEKRFSPAATMTGVQVGSQTNISQKTPGKAMKVFGLLALAWLLQMLLQGIFKSRLMYNSSAAYFIVVAMLGISIYLLLQKGIRYKLFAAAGGLIAVFLYTGDAMAVMLNSRLGGVFKITQVMNFSPYSWSLFRRTFLFFALAIGSALCIWILLKRKEERPRLRLTAGVAAAVYVLCNFISWLVQNIMNIRNGRLPSASYATVLIGLIADAVIIYLSVRCTDKLCKNEYVKTRVKLYGIGLVWAWIALIAMVISALSLLSAVSGRVRVFGYATSILLVIGGLIGYSMLLSKRRMGLYIIISASVLILGGQIIDNLTAVIYSYGRYVPLLFSSLFGALNPLFAWLAVRAADRRASSSPGYY
jgi:hypothetical protein